MVTGQFGAWDTTRSWDHSSHFIHRTASDKSRLRGTGTLKPASSSQPAENLPRLHPALGEVYRARVAELAEALQRDDHREALELTRGLIERVTLTPLPDGAFEVELEGIRPGSAAYRICLGWLTLAALV